MVKGLTYANSPVNVKINDRVVGQIFPYRYNTTADRDTNAGHWFTQIIRIGKGFLRSSGDNEIQLEAVGILHEMQKNMKT
ncbi:MAG: hypothetical protein AYK18_13195 [Theionarchaea archaeon DG-70]|nr:MAG: hypothetical protein AYK18_13195 [Theionarchaea archaeon DG-70]